MKSIGLFEAKNKLSEVCETVARSTEPVVVTRRGKPLVQITPYPVADQLRCVWDTVKESRAKYGELTDEIDIEDRALSPNRKSPLD